MSSAVSAARIASGRPVPDLRCVRTMRGLIAGGSELEPKRKLQLAVVEASAGDLSEERIAELGHGIAHDRGD